MKAQILAALVFCSFSTQMIFAQKAAASWKEYLGGPDSSHYSALKQINTSNVNKIDVAWTYRRQTGLRVLPTGRR